MEFFWTLFLPNFVSAVEQMVAEYYIWNSDRNSEVEVQLNEYETDPYFL